MVGDSGIDIATARAAGVPIVAVDFGYSETPIKELGADRLISHSTTLRGLSWRSHRLAAKPAMSRKSHLRSFIYCNWGTLDAEACSGGNAGGGGMGTFRA